MVSETSTTECPVSARSGLAYFTGSWVAAAFVSSIIVVSVTAEGDDVSVGVLAASLLAGWTVYAVGITLASRQAGSGDVAADFGIAATPIDAIGLPLGVTAQLLLPLLYAPLEAIWPATFNEDALSETAKDLVDRADGAMLVVLVLVVVIGAPVAEELFYRGLLQRPLLAQFSPGIVVVGVAALFALIHFRPVEYLGLFGAGLLFGVCAWRTRRLGMSIAAHVAFNATGMAMAIDSTG